MNFSLPSWQPAFSCKKEPENSPLYTSFLFYRRIFLRSGVPPKGSSGDHLRMIIWIIFDSNPLEYKEFWAIWDTRTSIMENYRCFPWHPFGGA